MPIIRKSWVAFCLIFLCQPVCAAGRGYLGVWFGPLPANGAAPGLIVNKVFADSAAERAGLKPGEIVTQIDGVSVHDPNTAVALLAENPAGESISLTVIDGAGNPTQIFATLAADPPSGFASIMTAKRMPHRRPGLPASSSSCIRSSGARDQPCRAPVVAQH